MQCRSRQAAQYFITFTLSTFIIIIKYYDAFYHADCNYFYFNYNKLHVLS